MVRLSQPRSLQGYYDWFGLGNMVAETEGTTCSSQGAEI